MATTYLTPGVYVEEVDRGTKPIEGVGTAVAAFIGIAEKGPSGKPTMIANWGQFTDTFGEFVPGAFMAHSVYGYFANGGGLCYVIRVNGGDEAAEPAPPAASLTAKGDGGKAQETLRAIPKPDLDNSEGISVEVTPGEDDSFDIKVSKGDVTESHEGLTMGRGAKNAAESVTKASKLVVLEEQRISGTVAERAPAPGSYPLVEVATTAVTSQDASPAQYAGNVTERTGIGALEAIDEITMIAAPDLMAAYQAGALDMDAVKAVQTSIINHCERMGDRVAILDTPPDLNVQEVSDWRMKEAGYDSSYAALYYPWIQVADPTPGAASSTMLLPPSGHVAGLWARSDGERGVHKAPANEIVSGALGLEIVMTDVEQGVLNPNGVNCIRTFPGRGIRVWGARTLSSDPSWRYVNVRRLFNYVEKSILRGTQWVVFEPNDMALWERVKRDVSGFLKTVWMSGALFGATADQSFYVKCDEENNPQETRDLGQLFIDIGIAPVKPAEFVVFRIGQYSPEE